MSALVMATTCGCLDMDAARLARLAKAAEKLVRARNNAKDAAVILAALGLGS